MSNNLFIRHKSEAHIQRRNATIRKPLFLMMCFVLVLSASFSLHQFYISKTTIEYNSRTQGFEVSCKFFTDDLEAVLSVESGQKVVLSNTNAGHDIESLVENYVSSHLKIWFDDQPITMRYVGKETEADLTYVYLEFFRSNQFHVCKLENTFLYEQIPEQQNIVDMKVDGFTSTLILTKKKSSDLIFR